MVDFARWGVESEDVGETTPDIDVK